MPGKKCPFCNKLTIFGKSCTNCNTTVTEPNYPKECVVCPFCKNKSLLETSPTRKACLSCNRQFLKPKVISNE